MSGTTDAGFKPTAVLADYLKDIDPDKAVKLARELCDQLEGDPDSFHGGIWPGNVTLDADGKAVLGPADHSVPNQRPADQVEYLSPEHFWDNEGSAAADVYSIGLLLYAGCNGGYLPFQPKGGALTDRDRSSALRRRMKGETVKAPKGVSAELKKVIEKSLSYSPEGRYITAREFLTSLSRTDEALPSAADVAAAAAVAAAPAASGKDAPESVAEEAPAEEPVPEEKGYTEAEEAAVAAAVAAVVAADKKEKKRAAAKAKAAKEKAAGTKSKRPAASKTAPASKPAGEDNTAAEDGSAPQDKAPEADKAPAQDETVPAGEAAAPAEAAPASETVAPGNTAPADETAAPADETVTSEEAAPKAAAAAAGAGAAAGAAYMASTKAGSGAPAGKPQYKVQKDFEKAPRVQQINSTVPAAQKKKKRSKAIPILCGIASAILLGSIGYMGFGLFQKAPEVSETFTTPEAVPPSPIVVSPAPTETPAPTRTPRPSATPRPSPTPDANGNIPVVGGAGTETGSITIGGTGTGTGTGTGGGSTGTGTGSTGGTGGGTGTGTVSGGGTGTGGGYGTAGGTGGGTSGGTSGGTGGGTSNPGFTVESASGTVYLTGNQVRVRTGPGTGYSILGALNKGDSVTRTGTVKNGWTQVKYKGYTGYIYTQYLTDTAPTAAPAATPSPSPSASPEPIGASYTVTKSNSTYSSAKQAAGNKLACVADDADFKAITDKLDADSTVTCAWLGAEKQSDGTWKWLDSTTLESSDPHWDPSDSQSGSYLLLVKKDGTWMYTSSDGSVPAGCDGSIAYVVESTAS